MKAWTKFLLSGIIFLLFISVPQAIWYFSYLHPNQIKLATAKKEFASNYVVLPNDAKAGKGFASSLSGSYSDPRLGLGFTHVGCSYGNCWFLDLNKGLSESSLNTWLPLIKDKRALAVIQSFNSDPNSKDHLAQDSMAFNNEPDGLRKITVIKDFSVTWEFKGDEMGYNIDELYNKTDMQLSGNIFKNSVIPMTDSNPPFMLLIPFAINIFIAYAIAGVFKIRRLLLVYLIFLVLAATIFAFFWYPWIMGILGKPIWT